MAALSCPAVCSDSTWALSLGQLAKPYCAGDLELGFGERRRLAGLEQILRLILEMPQVGVLGERARRSGIAGHGNLLSRVVPGVRMSGRKKVRCQIRQTGGLLPFPRTGCALHAA